MIQPTTTKKMYKCMLPTRAHWSLDLEQSVFFLGPSRQTHDTRKWPRAWLYIGARRSSLDSLKMHFFRFRPLLRWFKIDKKAIIKMSINNCNLLIHTCAKLFILGSYIKQWQICHRRSTNKSQFDICPFLSPLVHCASTVFVLLFFWHSLLSQQSL